jgi:hypothetical protein
MLKYAKQTAPRSRTIHQFPPNASISEPLTSRNGRNDKYVAAG